MSAEATPPESEKPPQTFRPVVESDSGQHSSLLHISVRGWLALGVIGTVCVMSWYGVKVEEPLYSLVLLIAGVYFGQSTSARPKTT